MVKYVSSVRRRRKKEKKKKERKKNGIVEEFVMIYLSDLMIKGWTCSVVVSTGIVIFLFYISFAFFFLLLLSFVMIPV